MSSHFYTDGLSTSSTASGHVAHSIEEMFQCMWGYPHGLHCNFLIRGVNLSAHLHEIHGISGQGSARAECKWNHCGQELNKGSLCQHVEEIHMGVVYFCGCGSKFLRRDALNDHKESCLGQQCAGGGPFNKDGRQDVRR